MNSQQKTQQAHQNGIFFDQYDQLFASFAAEGKTSGPNSSPEMVNYTKLNYHRSRRIFKTNQLDPRLVQQLQTLDVPQKWTLITETWCGDAANSVPLIGRIAAINPLIDLKIVFRDENLELMDEFLTNNGRSIPKLIVTNNDFEVLFHWGPRPQKAQEIYDNWKNSDPKPDYHDFHITLQQWYQTDAGGSIQNELTQLLEIPSIV